MSSYRFMIACFAVVFPTLVLRDGHYRIVMDRLLPIQRGVMQLNMPINVSLQVTGSHKLLVNCTGSNTDYRDFDRTRKSIDGHQESLDVSEIEKNESLSEI